MARSSLHLVNQSRRAVSLAVVSALLVGCGGGGDDASGGAVPVITAQPADVAVAAGDRAVFRVAVEPAEGLSYQWLRNGVAIAGATAAEYSLAQVALTDSGTQYAVVVRNAAGSVQSNAARLTVGAVPVGRIEPAGGALATLGLKQWFVAYARSGDVLVWEAGAIRSKGGRLVRMNAAGQKVALAGSLQELVCEDGEVWNDSLSAVEHSDGNLYVSVGYMAAAGFNFRGDGGAVYRIRPDGNVAVLYSSKASAVPITPVKLVEGPAGDLYTVHLSTVSLYRLSTAGALSKVADLTAQPVSDQLIGNKYYSPFISLVATSDHTIYVSSSLGVDYRMTAQGSLAPVTFGLTEHRRLAAFGTTVYAYGLGANAHPVVMRRTADGGLTLFAGGVAQPALGVPQWPAPLPGWIQGFSQVFGSDLQGRIVMGGASQENTGYNSPYHLLVPAGL